MPISLNDWRKLTKPAREDIKNEILKYFTIRNPDHIKRVERAALLTAAKCFKQWKSRLVTEFVDLEKKPFDLFSQINEKAWAEFVREKTSAEFQEKSKEARKLALQNKTHHKMGTAVGMVKLWAKQDLEAEAARLPKPFSEIKDDRARAYIRASATCNKKTGFKPTLLSAADIEAYKELLKYDGLKQEGTFKGDVLVGALGPEDTGRTRG